MHDAGEAWEDVVPQEEISLMIATFTPCPVVNSPVVVGMRRSLPIRPLPSPADALHPSVSLPSVSQGVSHHDSDSSSTDKILSGGETVPSRTRSLSKASVAHPWHIFFFYRALLNSCLLLPFLLRENFLHQSILFSWSERENQCEPFLLLVA